MAKQISTAEENAIMEMHAMLNNLVGKYETHVNNNAIHQLPPCEHHSKLTSRLWGIGILSVASIIGTMWTIIKIYLIVKAD